MHMATHHLQPCPAPTSPCTQFALKKLTPFDVTLISDVGHPHFPGWKLIALLLISATIAASLSSNLDPRIYRAPRIRSTITRINRTDS